VVAEPLHERVCAELGPVSEEIVAQLGGLDVEGKQEPRSLGGDSSIAMEDSVDTVIRILNTCSGVCQGKARIWYHCVVCSCDQREPSRGNRLRDFEIFAREAGNEYYVMAGTGVASAIASSVVDIDDWADDDQGDEEVDARLAEHVRCWFQQFEQRPWWRLSSKVF
jgi:hypothetical protein